MGLTIQQIEQALRRADARGKGVKSYGKTIKRARKKAGPGNRGAAPRTPRYRVVGVGPNGAIFYDGTAVTKAAAMKLIAEAKRVPGVIHIELQHEDAFGFHDTHYDKNRRGVWQRAVEM